MDDIAIKVEHVGKTFKLPHDKAMSIKSSLINTLKRRRGYELQHALRDIDFEVKKGEFFGIVGKNGGGKSTLLKVISGIYSPTKGSVHVNGKLTPFIELGVGFNPELSGRENVFLNGALLGFNRKEMAAMYDDIVEFAELKRFMDQKLKNYSSGMQVRLAFSIAIRTSSDILVMDEVLAVGDAAFQKKCFEIFRQLKKAGRTIVLVTHDMANVEKFCDRVLVINEGKQLGIMTPGEAATIYARLNIDEAALAAGSSLDQQSNSRYGTGGVTVQSAELFKGTKKTNVFSMGENLTLRMKLKRVKGYETTPVACGLAIFDVEGVNVTGPNSELSSIDPLSDDFVCTLPNLVLTPGDYRMTIAVYHKENAVDFFDLLDKWLQFSVVSDHATHGIFEIEAKWGAK